MAEISKEPSRENYVTQVTTYNAMGAPPLPIGSTIKLTKVEAAHLVHIGHVRPENAEPTALVMSNEFSRAKDSTVPAPLPNAPPPEKTKDDEKK